MTPEERARAKEKIAQVIAADQGITIEQARARGELLGRSVAGTLDALDRERLTREAGWGS